jgi:hypothetical protein
LEGPEPGEVPGTIFSRILPADPAIPVHPAARQSIRKKRQIRRRAGYLIQLDCWVYFRIK